MVGRVGIKPTLGTNQVRRVYKALGTFSYTTCPLKVSREGFEPSTLPLGPEYSARLSYQDMNCKELTVPPGRVELPSGT